MEQGIVRVDERDYHCYLYFSGENEAVAWFKANMAASRLVVPPVRSFWGHRNSFLLCDLVSMGLIIKA